MSFNICLDGGMILLTPTIEKMIFLSSTCAIFCCVCCSCLAQGLMSPAYYPAFLQGLAHCVFENFCRLPPIIDSIREIESCLGDLLCFMCISQ